MNFPATLNFDDKRRLVAALLECACLATRQARDLVIGELRAEIKNQINRMDNNQQDVLSLVNTCLSFASVDNLFDIIAFQESGSLPWQRLNQVRYELCARAVESNLTQLMLDEVRPLLSAACSAAIVHQCFRQSYRHSAFAPASAPSDAYEAFLHLFDLGALAALSFVDRLAAHHPAPTQLRQWMQTAATMLQLPEPSKTPTDTPVYLLVQLLPIAPRATSFTVQAWAWQGADDCRRQETDAQPRTFAAVEKLVRQLIREVAEQYDTTKLAVELIVPRHLFCADFSAWKIAVGEAEGTLLFRHPLALRWLDRFQARRKHLPWRDKWAALQQNPQLDLSWLSCADECTGNDLIDSYAAPHCGAWLALGFVPTQTEDDLLSAALNAGTPIALWFRHLLENELPTQATVLDLVARAAPLALPQQLLELRRQQRNDKAHPIHRLTLLFDDYHRVPPTLVTQAPTRK